MSITQIIQAPPPTDRWYAAFPQVDRGTTEPGDTALSEVWGHPAGMRPGVGQATRPLIGTFSSGGTGVRYNFQVADGVLCYEHWTDAALALQTWNQPYAAGPPMSTAVNPGYAGREASRVLRVRFGFRGGAGTPRDNIDSGVGLFASSSTVITGSTIMPTGADNHLICSVRPVNLGAGVQGWAYNAFDAAGAVIESVALDTVVPDGRQWSVADFEVIGAAEGRPAELSVAVNGVEVVAAEFGSSTLLLPSAFEAIAHHVEWGSMCEDTLGLSTPMFYWWEARGGRFDRDGVQVT